MQTLRQFLTNQLFSPGSDIFIDPAHPRGLLTTVSPEMHEESVSPQLVVILRCDERSRRASAAVSCNSHCTIVATHHLSGRVMMQNPFIQSLVILPIQALFGNSLLEIELSNVFLMQTHYSANHFLRMASDAFIHLRKGLIHASAPPYQYQHGMTWNAGSDVAYHTHLVTGRYTGINDDSCPDKAACSLLLTLRLPRK